MNKTRMLLIIFFAAYNLSFYGSSGDAILTHHYGIVTQADLDEEAQKCPDVAPFPLEETSCFNYWQCLPTEEIFLDCEDIGDSGYSEHTGQIVFWIKDGDNIHHYLTRRNFDMESCYEWMAEWQSVMAGEDIVCISGNYGGSETSSDRPIAPEGTHHYWIIDRMKSLHSEWSYFLRGEELEEELKLVEERRRQRELEELELAS